MSTATVLSGVERRRRWTPGDKARIVAESLAPLAIIADVARRHDVHPNLLHAWRREAQSGGPALARAGAGRFVPVALASGMPVGASGAAVVWPAMVEVVLRNGRVLRVPEGVAAGRAASLAAALEGIER
ncbi:MAG TPA: transposase [Acidiferrobacterales bacterium]